ncbi:MAG: cryptochrome/photolyase family protein [Saprospiraceae bacterium]|nr:cryptochrome/photolyase family protein [Saprospiraceae bacterium]
MKKSVNLIFPHQLFADSSLLANANPILLVEEFLFFRQYPFHKQKLAFHRASMKTYAEYLIGKGREVQYVESFEEIADVRKLIPFLKEDGVEELMMIDVTDDWLNQRISTSAERLGLKLEVYPSPLFLNTRAELGSFFKPSKKKFFQTKFYISQRKKWEVLLVGAEQPVGGKWSFDAENRKKYPQKKIPPLISYPESDLFYEEACRYVAQYFKDNPGELTDFPLYPYNYKTTLAWFRQFLSFRFFEFGDYEDAIVADESILHHSVLTPMLNVGLITPKQILLKSLNFAAKEEIPINSTEGFIRQIIGWREFIRGIYECKGREERTLNNWGFNRKIPESFYTGETGILPLDQTIKKVLRTGYCHHIERLMVLGNFMLLCEFDPDEVYRWFMELFIDAYDWVMVPNVYGMSQFADGGLMSTKPYISGSNYLMKMSNYKKGPWQETWDALFWRFMHVHRDFFTRNPRLGMLVRTFDKMNPEKQELLLKRAEAYHLTLDQ